MSSAKKRNDLLKVLQGNGGNISDACAAVGVSRETFYLWKRTYPKFNAAYKAIEAHTVDNAKSILYKEVISGNVSAIGLWFKINNRKVASVEEEDERFGSLRKAVDDKGIVNKVEALKITLQRLDALFNAAISTGDVITASQIQVQANQLFGLANMQPADEEVLTPSKLLAILAERNKTENIQKNIDDIYNNHVKGMDVPDITT